MWFVEVGGDGVQQVEYSQHVWSDGGATLVLRLAKRTRGSW
jgi:hypothetical protein